MAEPDVARSAAPAVPLTRRASLTVAAFGLDFGVKTAVGLVITPLLVGRLGTALFGTWEMLDRLAGYVATVGGRPSEALRLLVANRQSVAGSAAQRRALGGALVVWLICLPLAVAAAAVVAWRSEEHTSELQSHSDLVCRLLLEKKKKKKNTTRN